MLTKRNLILIYLLCLNIIQKTINQLFKTQLPNMKVTLVCDLCKGPPRTCSFDSFTIKGKWKSRQVTRGGDNLGL